MIKLWFWAAGGSGTDLTGLVANAETALEKIGSLLLVVFIGYKAMSHIAQDRFGSAIALVVVALIPALFLFDPNGAESLLKNTVNTLTGG